MNMNKGIGGLWLATVLMVICAPAWSQEPVADSNPAGGETRAWLSLQQSNTASAETARPMQGDVADAIYERYLKSFTHPIPEKFESEEFVTTSN